MAETAAEKRARLKAAIARAKANPNAADKGTAGDDAVKKMRANSKKKAASQATAQQKKKKATAKRKPAAAEALKNRRKKIDQEVKRSRS